MLPGGGDAAFLMSDPFGWQSFAGSGMHTGGKKAHQREKKTKAHLSHTPTPTRVTVAHCLQRSRHQGHAAAECWEPMLIISHIFRYECLTPRSFSSSYPY